MSGKERKGKEKKIEGCHQNKGILSCNPVVGGGGEIVDHQLRTRELIVYFSTDTWAAAP
jgi:hypothetical protein